MRHKSIKVPLNVDFMAVGIDFQLIVDQIHKSLMTFCDSHSYDHEVRWIANAMETHCGRQNKRDRPSEFSTFLFLVSTRSLLEFFEQYRGLSPFLVLAQFVGQIDLWLEVRVPFFAFLL